MAIHDSIGSLSDPENTRSLETIKADLCSRLKVLAFLELQATDYLIIREMEGGEACPSATKLERAAIRQKCNDLQACVLAAKSTAELDLLYWNEPIPEEAPEEE